ncbi:MAG: hypothetical protein ACLS4Z_10210 [Christensenellaceae bacterium]
MNFKPVLSGDTLTVEIPGYRDDVDDYPDLARRLSACTGTSI